MLRNSTEQQYTETAPNISDLINVRKSLTLQIEFFQTNIWGNTITPWRYPMKLYDSRGPNPKLVRMFAEEKGIQFDEIIPVPPHFHMILSSALTWDECGSSNWCLLLIWLIEHPTVQRFPAYQERRPGQVSCCHTSCVFYAAVGLMIDGPLRTLIIDD